MSVANQILGAIAADVDDALTDVAPSMTFALVTWVKGKAGEAAAVAILSPPVGKPDAALALRTAAAALDGLQ